MSIEATEIDYEIVESLDELETDFNIQIYNNAGGDTYKLTEASTRVSELLKGMIEMDETILNGNIIKLNPEWFQDVDTIEFVISYMNYHSDDQVKEKDAPQYPLTSLIGDVLSEEEEIFGEFFNLSLDDIDDWNVKLCKIMMMANYMGMINLQKKIGAVIASYMKLFGHDEYMNAIDSDLELAML